MKLSQERIYQAASLACLLCAALFSIIFIYVALSSITYPFNLEWMEGHTVEIMQRIRDGEPVYAEPTLAYVPYLYTPLYFYISAFVSLFTGVDFFAPRLVSLAATLGTSYILYSWVRREGGGKISSLVAAGLFLATYKLSGRWFDVARIDSLYLFLMVSGLYFFYFMQDRRSAIISGCLFAAAFFTKQAAPLALLPPFIAGLYIMPKRALYVGAVAFTICVVGAIIFELASDGWFSFYIYNVPSSHPNDNNMLSWFWLRDMGDCRVFLVVSLFALFISLEAGRKKFFWYLSLFVGFLGIAYASRIHSYGHINVLMPLHFIFALFTGVALAHMGKISHPVRCALPLAVLLQFYFLQYDYTRFIPTQDAIDKGNKFLAEIEDIPGDILFTEVQWIQSKVGKKTYSLGMAGFDITRADLGERNDVKKKFIAGIEKEMRDHKYSAVITGRFLSLRELNGNYKLSRTIDTNPEFVTGAVSAGKANVYVPIMPGNYVPPKP